jgi:hypothetical protein
VSNNETNPDRLCIGPYVNMHGQERRPVCLGDYVSGDRAGDTFRNKRGRVIGFTDCDDGSCLAVVQIEGEQNRLFTRYDLRLLCEEAHPCIGESLHDPAAPAMCNLPDAYIFAVHGTLSGEEVDQEADYRVQEQVFNGSRSGWIVWQYTVPGGDSALVGCGRPTSDDKELNYPRDFVGSDALQIMRWAGMNV